MEPTQDLFKQCSTCQELLLEDLFFNNGANTCLHCQGKSIDAPQRRILLTPQQINEAIVMYQSGLSLQRVADELDSNYGNVQRALKKRIKLRTDSHRAHKLDSSYFSAIDTPAKAYWLGFLTADGSVYGTRIQINLKDREHLVKFTADLQCSAPVRPILSNGHPMFKVGFRSKTMVGDLANLGIHPKKSFTVKPWTGPIDLMPHYWRGVVDGDGWVGLDHEVGLCGNEAIVVSFFDYIRHTTSFEGQRRPIGRIEAVEYSSKKAIDAVLSLLYGATASHAPALERKVGRAQVLQAWARKARAASLLPEEDQ
jgi:hypothetical protein